MKLRLIPLGTSAGRPTLARGASALAVAAEGAWVLCDCGEGAQLAALRAGLSLSRLDAVLITHLHGDHFNGLPGLLGTLGLEGRQRPLIVAGPPGIADLLQHLARAGSLGTGDMEVRVSEQHGAGGEVRLDGSIFHGNHVPLNSHHNLNQTGCPKAANRCATSLKHASAAPEFTCAIV